MGSLKRVLSVLFVIVSLRPLCAAQYTISWTERITVTDTLPNNDGAPRPWNNRTWTQVGSPGHGYNGTQIDEGNQYSYGSEHNSTTYQVPVTISLSDHVAVKVKYSGAQPPPKSMNLSISSQLGCEGVN